MSKPSVYHAMDYIFSLGVFGFMFFIFNLIVQVFATASGNGTLQEFAGYMWYGTLIIFLIFGPFWFFNRLRDWNNPPNIGGGV